MVPLSVVIDIWKRQPGDYFCVAVKNARDRWHEEFFGRNELDEVDDFVAGHRRCDVYWSVNGYSRRSRLNKHAVFGGWLYADLDPVHPGELLIEPTVAIKTSERSYQALWRCDSIASVELNQALAKHVRADKGTWAANKVLRVPGTRNYKYDDRPRVKVLWDDGPTHRIADLARALRDELRALQIPQGGHDSSDHPSAASFDEYDLKLRYVPAHMRRHLTKVINEDRSGTWWALACAMRERGAHIDHVLFMIERSYAFCDKFKGRPRDAARELERLREKLGSRRVA